MAQIIIVIINTRSIIIRMVRMNCGHVSPTDGAVWCDGTPPLSLTFLLTSFFFSYIYIYSLKFLVLSVFVLGVIKNITSKKEEQLKTNNIQTKSLAQTKTLNVIMCV